MHFAWKGRPRNDLYSLTPSVARARDIMFSSALFMHFNVSYVVLSVISMAGCDGFSFNFWMHFATRVAAQLQTWKSQRIQKWSENTEGKWKKPVKTGKKVNESVNVGHICTILSLFQMFFFKKLHSLCCHVILQQVINPESTWACYLACFWLTWSSDCRTYGVKQYVHDWLSSSS